MPWWRGWFDVLGSRATRHERSSCPHRTLVTFVFVLINRPNVPEWIWEKKIILLRFTTRQHPHGTVAHSAYGIRFASMTQCYLNNSKFNSFRKLTSFTWTWTWWWLRKHESHLLRLFHELFIWWTQFFVFALTHILASGSSENFEWTNWQICYIFARYICAVTHQIPLRPPNEIW